MVPLLGPEDGTGPLGRAFRNICWNDLPEYDVRSPAPDFLPNDVQGFPGKVAMSSPGSARLRAGLEGAECTCRAPASISSRDDSDEVREMRNTRDRMTSLCGVAIRDKMERKETLKNGFLSVGVERETVRLERERNTRDD